MLLLVLTVGLALAGCTTVEHGGDDEAEPADESAVQETDPETEPEREPDEPEPEPEPVPDGPEVQQVGDLIERPTADLIVEVLEQRDVIETDFDADIVPSEGERLWYVDVTWTNNLSEVIEHACHGPYSMQLHAFDLEGREMLMVDQPGYIAGQACSGGLMQGQTGRWQSAFHSLDEEFGWLLFDDYNGEIAVVTLDPDLELYFD